MQEGALPLPGMAATTAEAMELEEDGTWEARRSLQSGRIIANDFSQ